MQKQTQLQIDYNRAFIQQRHDEIEQIARKINEVHDLMEEVHSLTITQGGIIDNIEANMGKTLINVSEGKRELLQAKEIQKESTCSVM